MPTKEVMAAILIFLRPWLLMGRVIWRDWAGMHCGITAALEGPLVKHGVNNSALNCTGG
jgi:hypothetical protein